jgi:hypothetical protein
LAGGLQIFRAYGAANDQLNAPAHQLTGQDFYREPREILKQNKSTFRVLGVFRGLKMFCVPAIFASKNVPVFCLGSNARLQPGLLPPGEGTARARLHFPVNASGQFHREYFQKHWERENPLPRGEKWLG